MKEILILIACVFSLIACKKVEEKIENSKEITEKEWDVLFDGTSFDNWRGYLKDSMPSEWTIKDKAMVFTPSEKGGNNIITKKTYTNFILSLEWKISEGGNSGIFWGVFENSKFSEAYMTGPEIQVLDNEKHPDSFVAKGTHKAGSLYDMIACPDENINSSGEWNLCVIEVNHNINSASVTMNGVKVMSFPVSGEKWDDMVENSKFNGWAGFGKYQTGHIGLQDHGDIVSFKNIKIKEL